MSSFIAEDIQTHTSSLADSSKVKIVAGSATSNRGIYTVCDINPGDVVVAEKPIISWVYRAFCKDTCSYCYHILPDPNADSVVDINATTITHETCSVCDRVSWCNNGYCKDMLAARHTLICPVIKEGNNSLEAIDDDSLLHLCANVKAMELLNISTHNIYRQSGDSIELADYERESCRKVHELLLKHNLEMSMDSIEDLYKKDLTCGFAIMVPPHRRFFSEFTSDVNRVDGCSESESDGDDDDDDDDGDSGMIRGFGVLPEYLGMTNHSCMPNCIRWDNADSSDDTISADERRTLYYRALSKIDENTEILQSYVPLSWGYNDRQKYLYETFYFHCQCKRCTLEGKCYDVNDMNKEVTEAEEYEFNLINIFLLKHCCDNFNGECTGTLTPTIGYDIYDENSVLECNTCGHRRSNDVFLSKLKAIQ